jgi:hypothetical protein
LSLARKFPEIEFEPARPQNNVPTEPRRKLDKVKRGGPARR